MPAISPLELPDSAAERVAPAGSARTSSRVTSWLIASVVVLMAIRLADFVNRHAVNIIYWDQWDSLQGLFDGADAWTLFRWQHGSQRQGLGNLISAILYPATGWNARADAAAIAVMMLLAVFAGLWLVRRVCGPLRPWDIVVPLIFLTTASAETYVLVPNLAHGPLPALLLTFYALALTIRSHAGRCAAIVVLNFLSVNTGFTVLLGGVTPLLLLVFAAQPQLTTRDRALYALSIAASLATGALFLYGFVPLTAVDCFVFPHPRPWEYVPFAGFVMARSFGFLAMQTTGPLVVATSVAIGMSGFAAYAALRFVRARGDSALWGVTCLLAGFTVLFAATTAIGRICLGLESALASRYIPYMLPGMLAVYLAIRTSAPTALVSRGLLALFLVGCITKETSAFTRVEADTFSKYKLRWRDCYLWYHDIVRCDSWSGHEVYPQVQAEASRLQQKLDWLEARNYSLFQQRERAREEPSH